jgi:N-acetylglutamate synthase
LAPEALVEAIERATLAAVCPEVIEVIDGWLLPMDSGSIGRAKSAVPLHHEALSAAEAESLVSSVEDIYQSCGHKAVFRLPWHGNLDPLHKVLSARGYRPSQPTWVQTGSVAAMRSVTLEAPADVDDAPDKAWAQLFLGEGFDPVDGAHRIRNLSRSKSNVYASLRESGHTLAGGAASFAHGWASVHGMRTHAAERGKGLAGRVLAGLAGAAKRRGFTRVFLQVEADNPTAQALHQRAGFTTAWIYAYWKKPA